MSGKPQKKAYEAPDVTVTFEPRRCLHTTECLNGLPEVFDASRRPWIQPEAAPADRLAEVVRRCPSGALRYQRADGGRETPDRPTHITPPPAGQLVVRGELSLDTQEGTQCRDQGGAVRLREQSAESVLRPLPAGDTGGDRRLHPLTRTAYPNRARRIRGLRRLRH